MATLFDPSVKTTIMARIERLNGSTQPVWGRMNVGQMVVHCRRQLELALGDLQARPVRSPVGRFPMKQLFIYFLPTPHGVPTLPELRDPLTAGWEQDRAALMKLVDRFTAYDPAKPLARHAAFGELTRNQWGILAWKHLDHHLRQFGV